MAQILSYETKVERAAKARARRARRKAWLEYLNLVSAIIVAELIVTGILWLLEKYL